VARLFGRRFDHNGQQRRLGLTRAQCRILGYLARNEGINQAGLADLLEIRPMTLVRQIDRMEDTGWIERRADPGDRRARRLFLTEKGRRVLTRIWDVASETSDEALARLSPGEADQVIELLLRVHATLSERLPPPVTIAEPEEPEPPRFAPPRRERGERTRERADALPVVEVTR
jgi:DNA-binding MarR family transcriptional regulator